MTQTVLLGDIADIFDCPHSTPKWTKEGVLVLRNQHFSEGSLDLTNPSYTDEYHYLERVKRAVPEAGDIVLTREAPMGRVAIIPEKLKCCLGQRMVLIKPHKVKVNGLFLFHVLRSPSVQSQIAWSENTGSTVSNLRIPNIKKLQIKLVDTDEQKKIADILGTIDGKIELNRRMNETLEQIGQALFRQYFIVNPEAEKSMISDFASHSKISINPSKSLDTLFYQYSIPAFDNSMSPEATVGADIKSGKYSVINASILVSKLNPATPRIWPVITAQENAICSTEFQVIVPKEYYAFIYFLLTSREYSDKMAMMTSGTSNSHRRINPADILNYSFNRPSEVLLDEFEVKAKDYIIKIDQNRQEIRTLITLRDALLPQLISGRVKV